MRKRAGDEKGLFENDEQYMCEGILRKLCDSITPDQIGRLVRRYAHVYSNVFTCREPDEKESAYRDREELEAVLFEVFDKRQLQWIKEYAEIYTNELMAAMCMTEGKRK
jgi:hypothetical protein